MSEEGTEIDFRLGGPLWFSIVSAGKSRISN